jgi:hypothetical protein
VGNSRGQLAERGHLLGLNETGLGGLQVAVGGFSGIPCRPDLGLRAFTLCDVAVNQDQPAARHRIVPYLNNGAIRAGALKGVMIADPRPQPPDFSLGIGLAELAA